MFQELKLSTCNKVQCFHYNFFEKHSILKRVILFDDFTDRKHVSNARIAADTWGTINKMFLAGGYLFILVPYTVK